MIQSLVRSTVRSYYVALVDIFPYQRPKDIFPRSRSTEIRGFFIEYLGVDVQCAVGSHAKWAYRFKTEWDHDLSSYGGSWQHGMNVITLGIIICYVNHGRLRYGLMENMDKHYTWIHIGMSWEMKKYSKAKHNRFCFVLSRSFNNYIHLWSLLVTLINLKLGMDK